MSGLEMGGGEDTRGFCHQLNFNFLREIEKQGCLSGLVLRLSWWLYWVTGIKTALNGTSQCLPNYFCSRTPFWPPKKTANPHIPKHIFKTGHTDKLRGQNTECPNGTEMKCLAYWTLYGFDGCSLLLRTFYWKDKCTCRFIYLFSYIILCKPDDRFTYVSVDTEMRRYPPPVMTLLLWGHFHKLREIVLGRFLRKRK